MEVQETYTSRAWMAYDAGDRALADELTDRAAQLKKQFNEQFWIPERGYYAIALDGTKRQVDACASNMGHCLFRSLNPSETRTSPMHQWREAGSPSTSPIPSPLFTGFPKEWSSTTGTGHG